MMVIAGVLCIVIGFAFNPSLISKYFSSAGVLPFQLVIIVWVFDAALVGLGLILIYFRDNVQARTNLAVLFVAVTVSFVLAESVLRIIRYMPMELKLYVESPRGTGSFRLKRNLDIVTTIGGAEVTIKTNSHGMRWREVSYDNPQRKKRVAFVGDSFTFGLWADKVENSFVGVVDSLLKPLGFEVLNFGVPGYGLKDIELLIEDQVLQFRPDYLIVMFYNGNDFLDTYLGTDRYHVSKIGVLEEPNWDKIESKIPLEFRKERPRVHEFGLNKLYSYNLFKHAVKNLWPQIAEAMNEGSPGGSGMPVDRSYRSKIFWSRTAYPEFAVKAKNVSLEVLNHIKELCKRNGIQLILIAIPDKEQVYSPFAFGDGYDSSFPQKYIEEFAKEHSVPYLDLLLPLVAYAREYNKNIYYQNDGHFNNEGHLISGKLVVSFFRREVIKR